MKRAGITAVVLLVGCASAPVGSSAPAATPSDPRIAELQTSLTELLERIDVMNSRLTRLEESGAAPAPTPSVTPAAAPAKPPVPQASRALAGAAMADGYRTAIVLYGQNRPVEARAAFQRIFDSDPSGELADNALFWIGETYFLAADYTNAMRYYRRVADEYGDQNKAPDSLYKLGVAQGKTGDLALARKTLQEVIARYPYAAPATAAKAELNRIKY
ncbi:MAG: tol-pal system protein YbgF [Thermoanaerobaculia bacterium]